MSRDRRGSRRLFRPRECVTKAGVRNCGARVISSPEGVEGKRVTIYDPRAPNGTLSGLQRVSRGSAAMQIAERFSQRRGEGKIFPRHYHNAIFPNKARRPA